MTDHLNARQLTMWMRLRQHYWSTECLPLTGKTIQRFLDQMARRDPHDTISPEDLAELLDLDHGFEVDDDGNWIIPDLRDHFEATTGALARKREGGRKGGLAKTTKTVTKPTEVPVYSGMAVEDPDDF